MSEKRADQQTGCGVGILPEACRFPPKISMQQPPHNYVQAFRIVYDCRFCLPRKTMSASPNQDNRNSALDQIKGVLIFLVVFGHLIELYFHHDSVLRPLWIAIYTIHMPMFILISGMVSKAELNAHQSVQIVRNILAPLLAFELIYETTEYALTGKTSVYAGLIAPYWMLWYLMSLLSWRLMLPLFSRLRYPLIAALLVAGVTAYSEHSGYLLSLSRTMMFLPFFILGWQLGPDFWSKLPASKLYTGASVLILITTVAISAQLPQDFDYRWLYGSFSLHRLGLATPKGNMYQALQYLCSVTAGFAALYLLSRRNLGLARLGKHSVYVFLWHGMALIVMNANGWLKQLFELPQFWRVTLSVLASILITWTTAHRWTALLTDKLVLHPVRSLLLGLQRHQSH